MIRVLHVLQGMNRGGQETFIMNMYRAINRDEIQFDFLLNDRSHNDYEDEITAMGGRIYKTVTKSSGYLHFIKETNKVMSDMTYDYKIAHFHSGSLKSIYGWALTKVFRIKHKLAHSHNTVYDNDFKGFKKWINLLTPLVYSELYACSAEAGEWLYGNRISKKALVKVIPNGVLFERFKYDQDVAKGYRSELGLESCKVIGHVGRFVEQKNHGFLVDIFNELHEMDGSYRLLLVGEGPLFHQIEKKVHALGLHPYVQLLGNRGDVPDLYKAFDLFLLPSLYEGLPVVGVEAQVAGLDLVCSDTISKELSLTDLVTYQPLDQSKTEWAKTINLLLQKKRDRHSYKSHGLNAFDIHKTADYFSGVYRKYGN